MTVARSRNGTFEVGHEFRWRAPTLLMLLLIIESGVVAAVVWAPQTRPFAAAEYVAWIGLGLLAPVAVIGVTHLSARSVGRAHGSDSNSVRFADAAWLGRSRAGEHLGRGSFSIQDDNLVVRAEHGNETIPRRSIRSTEVNELVHELFVTPTLRLHLEGGETIEFDCAYGDARDTFGVTVRRLVRSAHGVQSRQPDPTH